LERAGVRERGRVRSWQDCLGLPPSFVSKCIGQREFERGRDNGRLGCVLVEFARKREERKEKKKVLVNSAKFHLNFEKCKVLIQEWG
jgi:hypothetical protein